MDVRPSAFADALDGFSYLVSLDMDELGKTLDERVIDIARLPDHADLLKRVLLSLKDAVDQGDAAR